MSVAHRDDLRADPADCAGYYEVASATLAGAASPASGYASFAGQGGAVEWATRPCKGGAYLATFTYSTAERELPARLLVNGEARDAALRFPPSADAWRESTASVLLREGQNVVGLVVGGAAPGALRMLAVARVADVVVAGVPSPAGDLLNGGYAQVGELYNNRTLFRKSDDPDQWLRYAKGGVWMVSATANKDANGAGGRLHCQESLLHTPALATHWKLLSGGKWEDAPAVTVVRRGHAGGQGRPLRISGALGPSAPLINGAYTPTLETYNDRTLFRKAGDGGDIWLRYTTNRVWVVSTSDAKGKNGLGGLLHSVEENLWDPAGAAHWKVLTQLGWEEQPGVSVAHDGAGDQPPLATPDPGC